MILYIYKDSLFLFNKKTMKIFNLFCKSMQKSFTAIAYSLCNAGKI